MKVIVSFAAAFLLVLVPLPEWADGYRPDWVVLVLIYWCLAMPDRVGPLVGWLVGLLMDVTQANLLGVNALSLTLVGYIANRVHLRVRMFPWWQQSVVVLALLLLHRGAAGWVNGFTNPVQLNFEYWTPCLAGMIIWPWLFVILRDFRRRARFV